MGDKQLFVDSSDSVIISDLLYFISNKLHSAPAATVVSICHQFYTDDEYVFEEKQKLFKAIDRNQDCRARRTDDKRQKNLEDICTTISQLDSRNDFLPKFASVDLQNVPISADGNPSLGQIMATLNDLRRKVVTTEMLSSSFSEFRKEIYASTTSSAQSASEMSSALSSAPPLPLSPSAPLLTQDYSANPLPPAIGNLFSDYLGAPSSVPSFSSVAAAPPRQSSNISSTPQGLYAKSNRNRTTSNNRRKDKRTRDSSRPQTIIGKSVKDGLLSVKGADLTVNRYIGRFHNDVTLDGVKGFIAAQNVTVIELEELDTEGYLFRHIDDS